MAPRPDVVRRIKKLLTFAQAIGRRPGWVAYALLRERDGDVTTEEFLYMRDLFDFKRMWVYFMIDRRRKWEKVGYDFEYSCNADWFGWKNKKTEYERTEETHDAPFGLREHLEVLGLRWPVTVVDVTNAYRNKVKLTHPDVGGTTEAFIAVKKAHEIITEWFDEEPPF